MTLPEKNKIFGVCFAFLFSVGLALPAQAARLYFEPQELVIGTEGEFNLAVNIDADEPINTLSVGISISDNLAPYDINEANSIINFWVEKPLWDQASRLLTFAGIVPGGFQGKAGRLLVVKLKTEKEGTGLLDFSRKETKVFLHSPDGIEDSLILEKTQLPIVKGKENIPVEIFDNEPPEWFAPEISQNPNMFGGKWFLVFATQDKASGIAGYFVHESTRKKEITRMATNEWVPAESPYVLKDQKLRKYIYVKAVDKAGNERIAKVEPRYPMRWYENWWIWVIIILLLVVLYIIGKILWRK